MSAVSCPHCGGLVEVTPALAGQAVRCPHCSGTFLAPNEAGQSEVAPEGIPAFILVLIFVAGHVLATLVLGAMLGLERSIALVLLGAAIEIAVWQRRRIADLLRSEAAHNLTDRARRRMSELLEPKAGVGGQPAGGATGSRQPTQEPEMASVVHADDSLVEIQVAAPPARRRERIPTAPQPGRPPFWQRLSGTGLQGNLPRDTIEFFGPGTRLTLEGRGAADSPLVYATGVRYEDTFDASLIDGTLPLAARGTVPALGLPYWPSYYECSPEQRARYVDWLLGGRCDPSIELGYVFIYFYGLERRVILDHADHIPIAQEVIRLCDIYSHSNSFRNYSSAFLWLTILLAGQSQTVPETLLLNAMEATGRWSEKVLSICLAFYCNRGGPLSEELALRIAQQDPRSRSSVVVKRHGEKFRELFHKRYCAKFGDGMILRSSKRPAKISYRPASGTLLRASGYDSDLALGTMPNVLAISSLFKPLLEIWEECIADLQAFNRAHRAAGGEELTAEAYEALPEELRVGDHPETETWMNLWQECADEDGWPLIPVSRLAELKRIQRRDRLTKAQCSKILKTADSMGIGLEPDARLTGRNYRWHEQVSPFFLETEQPEDMGSYNAAAVLLRLGLSVAEADGQVDESELALITEHLEAQFDLSANQSKRLEQLKSLLVRGEAADKTVSTTLRKRLPHDHRLVVGRFLVGIAAVDQVVTRGEVRALKNAYRALGLEANELDELLRPHAAGERKAAADEAEREEVQEFRLDMKAISDIMQETKEVSAILREAMAEDEAVDPWSSTPSFTSSTPDAVPVTQSDSAAATATLESEENPAASQFSHQSGVPDGLPARYLPFFQSAIQRPEWTQDKIKALAQEHGVMLGGAIEAINEWSCEHLGDWLIEEGDPVTVQVHLLE